jgi:hypothetical protein
MNDRELEKLFDNLESDRAERKSSIADKEKFVRQFVHLLMTYQITNNREYFLLVFMTMEVAPTCLLTIGYSLNYLT